MYQVLDEVLGFNGALRGCYQSLEGMWSDASKVNGFFKGCYDALAGMLNGASENLLTELNDLIEHVNAICAEIEEKKP